MIKKILSVVSLLFISFSANAEKVTIQSIDGFALAADYVEAKNAKTGVLMLHQCNADRSMYENLAKALAKEDISSLALDFRAYGESTTEFVSREVVRQKAKSREDYFNQMRLIQGIWPKDVQVAYDYLVEKVGTDSISYIGASCGGGQALKLAQNHKPNSFVFFSSGMDEKTIGLFEKVADVPALIIAAEGDEFTYKSSNVIFKKKKTDKTVLKTYKGKGHGFPLFEEDPKLEQVMVDWFKQFSK